MSTKKLQRSVIEGGRTGSNKWNRHYSYKEERAAVREYMSNVEKDVEFAEEDYEPSRKKVYKDFKDKLNPMYRWLHKQVGRAWNDVKSEVLTTFDTRTTAGRHITYDHLLSSVEEVPDLTYGRGKYGPEDQTTSYFKNDFYVDDQGTLCLKTRIKRNYPKVPKFNTNSIANWLNGRVVGKVGKRFFWFVPTTGSKKRGGYSREWKTEWGNFGTYAYQGWGLKYLYLYYEPVYGKNKDGVTIIVDRKPVWQDSTPVFRQDRKLNEKEMIFWNSLPEYYQTKILERSPNYPAPPKPYGYPYYY